MSIGFTQIEKILTTKLSTLSTLPSTVTGENDRLKATKGSITSFVRLSFRPTITEIATLGVNGQNRLNGLLIVDLFYPKNSGTSEATSDVDTIITAFEAGLFLREDEHNLSDENIVEVVNSYPTQSLPNLEKYYMKQVIVEWQAYTTRNT